jgi:hypothetical protein
VRNERRMLGSERGYGKPTTERSHGACSLLYFVIPDTCPHTGLVGAGRN